jgi:choline kinase/phosphohistidine swiveling domain-containing protein
MRVFLLGAGHPSHGQKPASLQKIASKTKAMDWQLHSFQSSVGIDNIYFLGGYHVEDVIKDYPFIKYQIIPDWAQQSVLHTLLTAQFDEGAALTAYSDTLFRKETIQALIKQDTDVVYAIDSIWKNRYDSRSHTDIESAETIIENGKKVEFTGLIYFSPKATKFLSKITEQEVGITLIDLIDYLKDQGFSTSSFDVTGHWAEFNSPKDIAHFILGTKSETLARLEPLVKLSHIGSQVSFTSLDWANEYNAILTRIESKFLGQRLVVRSSSKGEDNWYSSNAGGFDSILNVDGKCKTSVTKAINKVIDSFGKTQAGDDQILIQAFISEVQSAGVVFTCDLETGAPYYRFNFDDKNQSTESVTAGTHSDLRTVILNRSTPDKLQMVAPELVPVLAAIQELEKLLGFDKLDIEFAIDKTGLVHIFQVRPITVNHEEYCIEEENVSEKLHKARAHFVNQQQPTPFIFGNKNIFANMPDWNPAEIIGTRPKPLAFSLYRQLITDETWAIQRAEFGYRDVSPAPLLTAMCGQPYIDCRASINSFVPASLDTACAHRLANAYIEILADNPQFHDKIEFNVLFTVWTPDFLNQAHQRLIPYGVNKDDINQLESALKKITCCALTRLEQDIKSIELLNTRRIKIEKSPLTPLDKASALLDDCKKYGTLAFSHAARAGFVTTSLLKSFVAVGAISDERRQQFLRSFNTVAGEFSHDKFLHATGAIDLSQLIEKYGHLRPGTYDITTQAYWEDPAHYLISDSTDSPLQHQAFVFNKTELSAMAKSLLELGSSLTSEQLTHYFINSTQAREFVKFEFTRNLSKALDYLIEYGNTSGISRNDLAFLEYSDIKSWKINATSTEEHKALIELRKLQHLTTSTIELPQLIQNEVDLTCFERFSSQPNFVTSSRVEGEIENLKNDHNQQFKGKIILIPQADPGYDWLFGHEISGLITQYGGANSHMAIRAAEIGLPAAIGVGEKLYDEILAMQKIELDCENQLIRKIV